MSGSEKDRLSLAICRAEGLCLYCGRAPDDGQEVCRACGKRLTRKKIPPGRQVLKRSFPRRRGQLKALGFEVFAEEV